jgi:hypothetical protein
MKVRMVKLMTRSTRAAERLNTYLQTYGGQLRWCRSPKGFRAVRCSMTAIDIENYLAGDPLRKVRPIGDQEPYIQGSLVAQLCPERGGGDP